MSKKANQKLEERRAIQAPRAAALEARLVKGIEAWKALGRTVGANSWGIKAVDAGPHAARLEICSRQTPCACALSATMLMERGKDDNFLSFDDTSPHPVEVACRTFDLLSDEVRDFTWGFDFDTIEESARAIGQPPQEYGVDVEGPFFLLGQKLRKTYLPAPSNPFAG